MKTLIVYASKKGATKKCAEQIGEGIRGEVKLIECRNVLSEHIDRYDNIVMGSAVYAGTLDKALKKFCSMNQECLSSKRTFLFLGCMNDKLLGDYVKNNISEKVARQLEDVIWYGGAFYFSKMNFFEKFIIKKIANSERKANGEPETIDGKTDIEMFKEDNIKRLIQKINH